MTVSRLYVLALARRLGEWILSLELLYDYDAVYEQFSYGLRRPEQGGSALVLLVEGRNANCASLRIS